MDSPSELDPFWCGGGFGALSRTISELVLGVSWLILGLSNVLTRLVVKVSRTISGAGFGALRASWFWNCPRAPGLQGLPRAPLT